MNRIESYNRTLTKFLKAYQASLHGIDLSFEIPTDPQKFYEDFNILRHPSTNQPVAKLAYYQQKIWKDAWNYKKRMVIKSQKIGISTSCLMEDFHRAILPRSDPISCRGKEILIITPTLQKARDQLYTLRKMIKGSRKYKKFLIDKADKILLRDEVSKAMELFIYNPEDPQKPTRIIGLGSNESSVWSWKDVKHVHMSDVAATDQVDDSGLFGAAFSRLANTNGSMLIETPPRGRRGKVWDIYQSNKLQQNSGVNAEKGLKFKIYEIPASQAVEAGVITEEFLEDEKIIHGPLFSQLYECDFMSSSTSWYTEDMIKYSKELANEYIG